MFVNKVACCLAAPGVVAWTLAFSWLAWPRPLVDAWFLAPVACGLLRMMLMQGIESDFLLQILGRQLIWREAVGFWLRCLLRNWVVWPAGTAAGYLLYPLVYPAPASGPDATYQFGACGAALLGWDLADRLYDLLVTVALQENVTFWSPSVFWLAFVRNTVACPLMGWVTFQAPCWLLATVPVALPVLDEAVANHPGPFFGYRFGAALVVIFVTEGLCTGFYHLFYPE